MKLQIRPDPTTKEMPINVWLEDDPGGHIKLCVGNEKNGIGIAFVSPTGHLISYHLDNNAIANLTVWGFKIKGRYINTEC